MKKLIFILAVFTAFSTAHAKQAAALICGDKLSLFAAHFDTKKLQVFDSFGTIIWQDKIKAITIWPIAGTNPPQIQLLVDLQSAGTITGVIVDQLIQDKQGSYKEVLSGVYKGTMSFNKDYHFDSCQLQYE